METFIGYFLKSAAWLSGFALIYLVFLRNERFFQLKRIYLLSGILISIIFPLISIHYRVDMQVPASGGTVFSENIITNQGSVVVSSPGNSFDFKLLLLFLYLSGIIFLVLRIFRHLILIRKTIRSADISDIGPARLVRISSLPASFSFFNYVFINKSVDEAEVSEIMNHELVHVKQRHWLDLAMVELIRLFQWINPFVWIYTRHVRQNNEYLADELALQMSVNPGNYKAALVNQLFSSPVISLTNSFNYSLNKKRFEMMKKTTASPYRKTKVLLMLPVAVILFWAFATPEYTYTEPAGTIKTENLIPGTGDGNVTGVILKEDGTPFTEVAIVVTGTRARSKSDSNGKFSVNNVPENAFLVFSCAGYMTEVLKPSFKGSMTVKMVKDPDYKPGPSAPANIPDPPVQDDAFVVVEQMPYYPGGDGELLRFLAENTRYPEEAKAQKIEGRVILRFVVTTEGNTESISVIKGVHPLLDAEASRVVSMLKGFTPGYQGGKPVNVWYMVPITFSLPKSDTPR